MTVFADTFFYLALFNTRDAYHGRTLKFAEGFRGRILTTHWVLVEVADALAGGPDRQAVRDKFRVLHEDGKTRVVPASETLFERGIWLYHARPDKAWSLTDCISFIVMTDTGLTEALTGDKHFRQAGFQPLLV